MGIILFLICALSHEMTNHSFLAKKEKEEEKKKRYGYCHFLIFIFFPLIILDVVSVSREHFNRMTSLLQSQQDLVDNHRFYFPRSAKYFWGKGVCQ